MNVGDAGVVRRSGTGSGPKEFAVGFGDSNVVGAGFPASHQAAFVELPQLVAIAAMPLAGRVVPFVLKAYRDPVVGVCPQVLHEPVIEFAVPLTGKQSA